jgi:hypothetical protein
MDYAVNWQAKSTWTDDDTQILETIMADGNDDVWQGCTLQPLGKHSFDCVVRCNLGGA